MVTGSSSTNLSSHVVRRLIALLFSAQSPLTDRWTNRNPGMGLEGCIIVAELSKYCRTMAMNRGLMDKISRIYRSVSARVMGGGFLAN